MRIENPYTPSATQMIFHNSDADEILFGGQAGGGKSCGIVEDAFIMGCMHPGAFFYIFRRTKPELDDTVIAEMYRKIPAGLGKFNTGSRTFHVKNGAEIRFRSCQHEKNVYDYQGAEMAGLYIDEVTHWTLFMVDYLGTRLRTAKELGFKPQKKYTTNPGGIGHVWCKAYFIDDMIPNVIKKVTVYSEHYQEYYETTKQFIPSSLADNKHLTKDYILELERKPEKMRKALMYGDWDVFEGQAFPEWRNNKENYDSRENTHVIFPFEIPKRWPIFKAYDYGSGAPYSVLWFAISDDSHDNRLYLIHELYGGSTTEFNKGLHETAETQAEKIWQMEHKPIHLRFKNTAGEDCKVIIDMRKHGFIDGVADPSIWDNSHGYANCIGDIFRDHQVDVEGIETRHSVYFRDARDEKEVRHNVVNNRLQGKQLVHDALMFRANKKPQLQVFANCKMFIKHIPGLLTDPENPEDVLSKHVEDHEYDPLRYTLIIKMPAISAPPAVRKEKSWGNPLEQDPTKITIGI